VCIAILRLEINLFPTHFLPTGKANLNLQVHLPDKKDKFHPKTFHEDTAEVEAEVYNFFNLGVSSGCVVNANSRSLYPRE